VDTLYIRGRRRKDTIKIKDAANAEKKKIILSHDLFQY
jgi:hypothetical protein